MKNTLALAVGMAAAVAMSLANAQMGNGYGRGAGTGPGCEAGTPSAATCPAGNGYGPGPGYGRGNGYGPGGGQGMMLLTPEERLAFHTAMHSVTTLDECNSLVAQRQDVIAERAKAAGVAAPAAPRRDMCERMKAHGQIN